jgi:hypothetical protein
MSCPEKPIVLHATHAGRKFVIEEDKAAGFYIYVFEAERCTHDHLQDTLEIAKDFTEKEFGVPKAAWREGAE